MVTTLRRPAFEFKFPRMMLGVALLFASFASAAPRTNVIVILCDDLGYGDVSCYTKGRFKTPNIDKLANAGARLTQFYTPFAFCAPTRVSLQTGRYPFRTGLTSNPTPDGGINELGIRESEVTIGQAFHTAGYATGYIGKWHLGHKPEFYPTRHGYDEYLGILYSNDMRPVQLMEDEKIAEYPVVQATLTQRYTQRAVRFIEGHRSQPFFLMLAHAMPHKPLAASETYYKKSGLGLYADVMSELDWSIGQIVATLDRLKLTDNTLLWFTSDNGPWYGGSTGGLRGMKGRQYEGGIRVPLIAVWPGHIPAGHVSDAPGITMDIFATSLRVAGIEPPPDRLIDGVDIMPTLTSNAPSPHDVLYSFAPDRLCTVRSGRWKLHLCKQARDDKAALSKPWVDPRAPDGVTILAPCEQYGPDQYPGLSTGDTVDSVALFDIEHDLAEQHDVAAQHADVVERLQKLADQMRSQMPTTTRPARQKAKN